MHPRGRRIYNKLPGNTAPAAHRFGFYLGRSKKTDVAADPLARDATLACLEALLMLADEPLTPRKIADALRLSDTRQVREMINKLQKSYEADETAFHLVELAGGFQLLTLQQCHHALLRLRRTGVELRLSAAAMETLAVIAYKQPIMRAEIEKIRGVNCVELIRLLMEKGLVRIVGRHESLGRPQLFGTTRRFLQLLGLNSLDDLPEVECLNQNHSKKQAHDQ